MEKGGIAYIKNRKFLKKFRENISLGLKNNLTSGFNLAKNKKRWWEYQLEDYGSRSVFTEIDAAIGLPQLYRINTILKKKQNIRKIYLNNLNTTKNIKIVSNKNGKKYSNYFFTILTNKRDELAEYLFKNDVYTSFRYYLLNKIKILNKFCLNSKFID